ncbi:DUF2865 domain-containing protein [Enterovirga rhinocerotis]|uniref:Uncharacterized protein DUF2865 n=1 Tax=Enterovirga rhinocerotis TaxID=1339210 RepID=A0A4R7C6H5_9HYPH|nr:DUF2865 domain-containing protein [Enterovirga rhinocerotis]TDR93723.1 uncharacterized protein DUF2865 [Enterovirga rhinocerotis]
MSSDATPSSSPDSRRGARRYLSGSPALLGLASILCGLGLAASGVTLVRAADDVGFFDFFRNQSLDRIIDPVRLRPRYADAPRYVVRPREEARRRAARRVDPKAAEAKHARPGTPRKPVERRARVELGSLGSVIAGRRTMCVRTCDGYAFPLGILRASSDLPTHRTACAAACPGAETQLYTLNPGQSFEQPAAARSVSSGETYGRLRTAFLYRSKLVADCSCQGPDNIAQPLPILLDPTIRTGDIVVDEKGEAQAYAGTGALPLSRQAFSDYRRSRALGPKSKRLVDRTIGTSHRATIARAYERSQRVREASLGVGTRSDAAPASAARNAFREIEAPAGSRRVRVYTIDPEAGRIAGSGARIITLP